MRGVILALWLKIPYGKICSLYVTPLQKVTLFKNGMVEVTDGLSTDALPVSLISTELQQRLITRMRSLGYNID